MMDVLLLLLLLLVLLLLFSASASYSSASTAPFYFSPPRFRLGSPVVVTLNAQGAAGHGGWTEIHSILGSPEGGRHHPKTPPPFWVELAPPFPRGPQRHVFNGTLP